MTLLAVIKIILLIFLFSSCSPSKFRSSLSTSSTTSSSTPTALVNPNIQISSSVISCGNTTHLEGVVCVSNYRPCSQQPVATIGGYNIWSSGTWNTQCTNYVCVDTHELFNGYCLEKCSANQIRNNQGSCTSQTPPVISSPVAPSAPVTCSLPEPSPTTPSPVPVTVIPTAASSTSAISTLLSCNLQVEGRSPIPAGGTITERITCQNLPSGAVVKLVEITANERLNGGTIVPVTNTTPYVYTRTNGGTWTEAVSKYSRILEVYDSNNNLIYHTRPVDYAFSTLMDPHSPRCLFAYRFNGIDGGYGTGESKIHKSNSVQERIWCSNLTDFTEVRVIGTKNGLEVFNRIIAVVVRFEFPFQTVLDTQGDFYHDTPVFTNDSADKVGTYTRKITIIDRRDGRVIQSSPVATYELL